MSGRCDTAKIVKEDKAKNNGSLCGSGLNLSADFIWQVIVMRFIMLKGTGTRSDLAITARLFKCFVDPRRYQLTWR